MSLSVAKQVTLLDENFLTREDLSKLNCIIITKVLLGYTTSPSLRRFWQLTPEDRLDFWKKNNKENTNILVTVPAKRDWSDG